jgi:hypothetical protein
VIRKQIRWATFAVVIATLAITSPTAASPRVWRVTTTMDHAAVAQGCQPSNCSLRDAIGAAAVGDEVKIPTGIYTLSYGELQVPHDMTIVGSGARSTIIDGGGHGRVFEISMPATVTIRAVQITNGADGADNTNGHGAGIFNHGSLTLVDDAVRANAAAYNAFQANGYGGGIDSDGSLTVLRSAITDNKAAGVQKQLGVGYGGGIYASGALTVINSTIADNVAGDGDLFGRGGGIDVTGSGPVLLEHDTISANTILGSTTTGSGGPAGGNVALDGPVSWHDTIVAGGHGLSGTQNCGGPGPSTSLGHNIDSLDQCHFHRSTDKVKTAPRLGALGYHGGRTETEVPVRASVAVDRGDPRDCPATDQRGTLRPLGAGCDVGAVEVIPPPTIGLRPVSGVTSHAATLAARIDPWTLSATWHFEFGTTNTYGHKTPSQSLAAGIHFVRIQATLAHLKARTTYHFRLVASSRAGTTVGRDHTFRTG